MKNYERWPQKPPISTEKGDFIGTLVSPWIAIPRNLILIVAACFGHGNISIHIPLR